MATSTWELSLVRPARIEDPRWAQLAILSALLAYGAFALDFVLSPWSVPVAILTAWSVETALEWRERTQSLAEAWRSPLSGRRVSAVISALSALLLFRAETAWPYAAVVAFAILSKRIFRARGRHFVNPTNGAVVLGSLVLPGWIASGQWGHGVLLSFAFASGGLVVLTRAARLDTALAFLGGTLGALALRNLVYGHPWPTLGHAFTSGTLWLFALYMITDPKTTPQRRSARIAHGLWVAALAVFLQQVFYLRDAFLWALFVSAPLVPALDLWSARKSKGALT